MYGLGRVQITILKTTGQDKFLEFSARLRKKKKNKTTHHPEIVNTLGTTCIFKTFNIMTPVSFKTDSKADALLNFAILNIFPPV